MEELKLGELVATCGIEAEMNETYGFRDFCMHCVLRHRAHDWGRPLRGGQAKQRQSHHGWFTYSQRVSDPAVLLHRICGQNLDYYRIGQKRDDNSVPI